jgi:hypothetical protein
MEELEQRRRKSKKGNNLSLFFLFKGQLIYVDSLLDCSDTPTLIFSPTTVLFRQLNTHTHTLPNNDNFEALAGTANLCFFSLPQFNMELDLQGLFGLLCTAVLIG